MKVMNVLLAADGSKFSEAATRALASQMQPEGVEVLVLQVIEPHVFSTPLQEGEIGICVEPRRLAVCGRACARKKEMIPRSDPSVSHSDFVFRVFDLPVEIDPSQVTARFNGRVLEIDLSRARVAPAVRAQANTD
jgi:hypothetical protein